MHLRRLKGLFASTMMSFFWVIFSRQWKERSECRENITRKQGWIGICSLYQLLIYFFFFFFALQSYNFCFVFFLLFCIPNEWIFNRSNIILVLFHWFGKKLHKWIWPTAQCPLLLSLLNTQKRQWFKSQGHIQYNDIINR